MIADTLREHASGCTLAVRAQPGAKKTSILGVYGEGESAAIKIAIQAPPVDGRANEVLVGFLAHLFDIKRSSISILHGESGRIKLVLLGGVRLSDAQAELDRLLPS
jgi:uncharacterized protein (TIGR00251 family)